MSISLIFLNQGGCGLARLLGREEQVKETKVGDEILYIVVKVYIHVRDLRGLLLIGDLSYNEFISELVIKHELSHSR
jgi:hypothetical protein